MNSPRPVPMIGLTWDARIPLLVDGPGKLPGVAVAALPSVVTAQGQSMDIHVETSDSTSEKKAKDVRWFGSAFKGRTRVEQATSRIFEFSIELAVTEMLESSAIGWQFEAIVRDPRWLDNQYRLQRSSRAHLLDAWTPLLVKARSCSTSDHIQLIGTTFFTAVNLRSRQVGREAQLHGTIWLDHHHAHPRFSFTGDRFWNWHNPYTFQPGQTLEAKFRVTIDASNRPAIVCGRYPDHKRALISITDHADHDTCRKVSALFFGSSIESEQQATPQGFAGLGLPFTKTVFTKTDDSNGAGLHNPEYVAICDRAHAAGLEIGPHGIHETVEPPLAEFPGLIEPFKRYSPNTWIDHGRSFHCNYRLSGWSRSHEYNLEQVLRPLGIDCIWAGLDFGLAVPNRCLNQLQMQNFSGLRYLRDLPRSSWRAIRSGRPWAIAHEVAAITFQMMPDRAMKQYFEMHRHMESFVWGKKLKSLPPAFRELLQLALLIAKPSNLREVVRQFFGPRAELAMAPVMYREHETFNEPQHQRWLFNTIAVHDVEDAYAPAAVEQLQNEYGFHIAHTYLASMSRAHLSHALQRHPKDRDHWQLTPRFAANLEHMASLQQSGSLWVASIGEVCDFWARLRNVTVRPDENGRWRIDSPASANLTNIPIVILEDDNSFKISAAASLRDNTRLATVKPGETVITGQESAT